MGYKSCREVNRKGGGAASGKVAVGRRDACAPLFFIVLLGRRTAFGLDPKQQSRPETNQNTNRHRTNTNNRVKMLHAESIDGLDAWRNPYNFASHSPE
jgi:hypothetical protein